MPLILFMSTTHIHQRVYIQITHLPLHSFYQCFEFPQRIKIVHIRTVSVSHLYYHDVVVKVSAKLIELDQLFLPQRRWLLEFQVMKFKWLWEIIIMYQLLCPKNSSCSYLHCITLVILYYV